MEKSPSPVYGARLELVYALIAHRGFESLLLRHCFLCVRQMKALPILIGGAFFLCLPQNSNDIYRQTSGKKRSRHSML